MRQCHQVENKDSNVIEENDEEEQSKVNLGTNDEFNAKDIEKRLSA